MDHRHAFVVCLASLMLLSSAAVAAADCSLQPPFAQAIAAKDIATAKGLKDKITLDPTCAAFAMRARQALAALGVTLAESVAEKPGNEATVDKLLRDAAELDVSWVAAAELGDLRFDSRHFAEAVVAYDSAIELIKNATATPEDPGPAVKQRILNRDAQARSLAADPESGTGVYVSAPRDKRDGTLGGPLAGDVRGFKPKSVPLPIKFETGTVKPTRAGLQAAADLLAAIQEQKPTELLLIGHTDSRGSDEYNMRLSEGRVRVIAGFLADSGVTATIKIAAVGKREPVDLGDTTGLSQQDIWALNRFVEWRRQ